jgi:hypothetical protein
VLYEQPFQRLSRSLQHAPHHNMSTSKFRNVHRVFKKSTRSLLFARRLPPPHTHPHVHRHDGLALPCHIACCSTDIRYNPDSLHHTRHMPQQHSAAH